jgi:hypothetical protein
MFYNTRTQQILNTCPLNGYLEDGTLVQGLDISDFSTKKLCGILPVKSDIPVQPTNTQENVAQRNVSIDDDGVNIVRTWITNPITIPSTVSARQIRLWLISNNISLSSVDTAINNMQDQQLKEKTLVEWEFAPYVERNHPMINNLGLSLGLSSEQIDQAFVEASIL